MSFNQMKLYEKDPKTHNSITCRLLYINCINGIMSKFKNKTFDRPDITEIGSCYRDLKFMKSNTSC